MLTEINDDNNNRNNYENFIHAHKKVKNMMETENYPKNIFQNN